MTSDEVAGVLGISPRTVKYHRTHAIVWFLRENQSPRKPGRLFFTSPSSRPTSALGSLIVVIDSIATRLFFTEIPH
jgi:hypothetical protein